MKLRLVYTTYASIVTILLIIFIKPKEKIEQFQFNGIILNESSQFKFNNSLLQKNDYHKLIGIDFRFLIWNRACHNSEPFLLIMIHSSDKNFDKRMTIRETWGLNNNDVKTLYFLGNSTSKNINDDIAKENSRFSDIIQGSFVENYYNMSYKHGMTLKYALYHCPQTKYILRVDDDIFVNTPELIKFLKTNISSHGAKKCLMCNCNVNALAIRSYRSKWRVNFDEYRYKYYPLYCQGWHVLYSPDVIFQLYKELQVHRYFSIDDVLITGILVQKSGYVNHSDTTSLSYLSKHFSESITSKPNHFLFGGPEIDTQLMRILWHNVSENFKAQSI